ncbi:MAG: site-specific integrase [Azospirillum sp.]|nr:site-specific integrase [Azospirillum sp.]
MSRPVEPARLTQLTEGGTWYICWHDGTRDRRRSTRTRDRRQAEAALAAHIAADGKPADRRNDALGAAPRAQTDVAIADVLATYLESFPDGAPSAATAAVHVTHLVGYFGTQSVSAVTQAACTVGYPRFRADANARRLRRTSPAPIKPGTLRRELTTLQAALQLAVREARLINAPTVTLPAVPPPRERWLSSEEANALLDAADGHVRLFIELGLSTGARTAAILDLTWPQIDLVHNRIDFNPPGRPQTTKRRPFVKINAPLHAALTRAREAAKVEAEKAKRPPCPYVVNYCGARIGSVKRALARAITKAGLPTRGWDRVTAHVLRHTFATWSAQAGEPMHDIAGALGLSQPRTLEIYAHHHPDYLGGAADAVAERLATARKK